MNRSNLIAALVLAGCSGQIETQAPATVVEGAIGAGVSYDQRFFAYYAHPSRLPNGPYSGSLAVMPLPSGSAIPLGDGAFAAGFGASADSLYFFQQPAIDTTTSAYAGSLSIWTPQLDAPVALSSGYAPRSVTTPDHAATLFLDTPTPDQAATGQVKLLRNDECAGTSCPVQTLADGVALTGTRMSLDGRFAAYDTVTPDGETHAVFLVSVAGGTTTQVATTTIPPQVAYYLAAFSPDGSLLATITTIDGNPLQLQVISTATGAPVAWGAPPAGTQCTSVEFADSATLFVGVLDAEGNLSFHRTTATGESPFVSASQIFIEDQPSGAERYLFFSTTAPTALAAGAPYDLQMMDLSAPTASPILLAKATRSAPSVSDDLSTVWIIDAYDATTQLGTLVTASLPAGQLSTVATSVYSGSAYFGGGTNHLFYYGTAALPSAVPNATGAALFGFSQGKSQQVDPDALRWDSAPNPPTIYVTTDNPLRIYREPLP